MPRRWRIAPHDSEQVARLQRAAGVPNVIAQLLLGRGVTEPEEIREFLDAKLSGLVEPELLPGVAAAAPRLARAISERSPIVIYGDYDADGMTATAILYLCVKLLGGQVSYYVPNRIEEGYGLNDEALAKLAERGAKTIVTVDCGVASLIEAATARSLGIELIVTDHHELAPTLPDAAAIVHPRLPGSSYPFPHLCGAGVALKLAWAVCQEVCQSRKVSDALRAFLLQAVGLAAIGTVADVVPLVGENRILVRHGLVSLHRSPTVGMAALLKLTKLDRKPHLVGEDIAFTIGPRLNAAGRLGQAQLGVELLTTDSPARGEALAEYIHELNGSRESLERRIFLSANKQAQKQFDAGDDGALVLADSGWHAGVIGIVAGRLADKYRRPVVLVALDPLGVKPGVGSARSVAGFPLHEALAQCTHHLVSHGGHAAAAGLKIHEDRLSAFRAEFSSLAEEALAACPPSDELLIDVETPFTGLTPEVVKQIESLGPFGRGNQRPVMCTTQVELAGPPQHMGGGERHLSVILDQHGVRFRAVAFGRGEWVAELSATDGPLDVAFKPVINTFRGRSAVELHLTDWRASQAAAVPSAIARGA